MADEEEANGRTHEKASSLGDFIASQRRAAELSLRQLAERAGISNPYVSQIEKGLRRPSAEVLQQLAHALQVSAESLYLRAGIVHPEADGAPVERAIRRDPVLSDHQKNALIEVYRAFMMGAREPHHEPEPPEGR